MMEAKDTVLVVGDREIVDIINNPRKSLEDQLTMQAEITWPIAFKAGIREEQKRMTKALRELHKKGWTLADVIEAEDTCGKD